MCIETKFGSQTGDAEGGQGCLAGMGGISAYQGLAPSHFKEGQESTLHSTGTTGESIHSLCGLLLDVGLC